MKCWECKQKISEAHIVHYVSYLENKEMPRDVCNSCYNVLKFNPCHYVEVDNISRGQLDKFQKECLLRGKVFELAIKEVTQC